MPPHGTSTVMLLAVVAFACGDSGTPPDTATLELSLTGLAPLDAGIEGTYEAWVISTEGHVASAGRLSVEGDPSTHTLEIPIAEPSDIMITIEPSGDDDAAPSLHKLLGGRVVDGAAELAVTGYLTVAGVPLEPNPGTHVLANATDSEGGHVMGDGGIWLFNLNGDTLDGSYYLNFSPLTEGWAYEGWIVYDLGTDDAIWMSYGKFRTDAFRQANLRDDTGLGPFSGHQDYEFALSLQVRVPGDDWLANPLGLDMPGDLSLPFDLNGDASTEPASRWTHVITIEPWGPNRAAEPVGDSRPFFLAPYGNAIGEDPPDVPRVIEFDVDVVPSGTASIK